MNTTKRVGLLFCTITIFALLLSSITVLAQPKYLYAYGIKTVGNRLVVKAVDPGDFNTAKDILTISLPQGSLYIEALPSPNGEWVALMLDPYTKASLQLVNIKTGEIRNSPAKLLLLDDSYIFGRRQLIEWSADSRHLAFIGSQSDARKAFIYTVQNKVLMSLATDAETQYGLTWLSNGSQLAVLSYNCVSSEDCTHRVDIFGTMTRSLQTSISIALSDGYADSEEICQLQGSPNGRYLSFVQSCYPSALGSPKELYIIDVGRKKVTQLTNFSARSDVSPESPDYILYASYASFWYDNQTLLVGIAYYPEKDVYITKTIALRITNGSSTTLNSNMTSGWRFNPYTKELAVLTYNLANTPYDEIQNAAVQVGIYRK